MTCVEAVIVAGGRGTRLRPLTVNRPKHLLPVAGVPFVVHQLAKLAAAGVRRVVLATSFHAEMFEPALGDGRRWGIELAYVTEPEPLGTGGAIRNVAALLQSAPDAPVVVLNGDILSGHDLTAQLRYHEAGAGDVTLHLVDVPDARAYGCVPTADGRVTAFLEKSPDPVSTQVNAGCYVFTRAMIDAIPAGRMVSVERETFPDMLATGRTVLGYADHSYWIDVGTPAALCRASADVVLGRAPSPAYQLPPGQACVAADADVAADACVSDGSSVGPGATVGAGAVVRASVVASGARVAPDAVVVDSVVGPDAEVGTGTTLRDAVVGDGAVVGADCELLAGARVWVGADIAPKALRFSSDW